MITANKDQHFLFEVQLNWQEGTRGILTARDVNDLIHVAASPDFEGGIQDMWSPEHLFLSAICSCFMANYLAIAEKEKLTIAHFECSVIGQILLVEDHLEFTTINIFPKVFVKKEEDIVIANEVLVKTYKQSLIAHSIKPHLIHHGRVLLQKQHLAN